MRRQAGFGDQRLHTGQRRGVGDHPQARGEALGGGRSPLEHQPDQPAIAVEELGGEGMVGMRCQSRVMHRDELGALARPLGHGHGVGVGALDAQGQGLHPAFRQPGRMRINRRAPDPHEAGHFVDH